MRQNPLTFAYSLRHLRQRWVQTAMTLGGIALVVFVFTASLMLSRGLRETMVSTGSAENVIAIMTGAQNEVESGIQREAARIISTQPEVALAEGRALATADLVVLVSLKKRSTLQTSNVTVRGISAEAWAVRPQAKISAGRAFQRGTQELVVGEAIRRKFTGTEIGDTLRFSGTDWRVVGWLEAGNSSFNSEIWGDVDLLMAAFRREQFSSVTFKLSSIAAFKGLKARLEQDPRLAAALQSERDFYEAQSRDLAAFITYLGGFVSIVFSLGAVIGAMITMFGAVANRVREIGILRALGFPRAAVFGAFVRECLLIGALGGALGVLLASALSFVTFATANFATFAEVAFGFKLTPGIAATGIAFALLMSLAGGALPALRAARLRIVDSLRAE